MEDADVSAFLTYLESEEAAREFLFRCYSRQQILNPDVKSFENTSAFTAYLQHGKSYYRAGREADLTLQPVLLFYGMVHFMKASLLTRCPDYPESTSQLAHGLSARKRKKRDYSFLYDEIMMQQKGLFPYYAEKICGFPIHYSDKLSMRDLFGHVPELRRIYKLLTGDSLLIELQQQGESLFRVPVSILDSYHLSLDRFHRLLKSCELNSVNEIDDQAITIAAPNGPLWHSKGPLSYDTNAAVYTISKQKSFCMFHESMIHYALLYNLSMICRYETEWWYELLHRNKTHDYPLIAAFLKLTAAKFPAMIGHQLYHLFLETKKP